jgi:hypothetical protein
VATKISPLGAKVAIKLPGTAMLHLRDRPIQQKIMFVIMLISAVVLLFAFATLFYFQAYTLRQQSAHELAVVGEITAHNCAAAVMFKDEDAAAQLLTGLKTMPQIGARLLDGQATARLLWKSARRGHDQISALPVRLPNGRGSHFACPTGLAQWQARRNALSAG